jgi:hypothetical protein
MGKKPGALHLTNPGAHVSEQEKERAEGAVEELRSVSAAIFRRYGGIALIDALISVWLDMNLTAFGVALTDEALRELRRDLPKIAAAHRAMDVQREGRPDA